MELAVVVMSMGVGVGEREREKDRAESEDLFFFNLINLIFFKRFVFNFFLFS